MRKTLGRWKYLLFQHWPYIPLKRRADRAEISTAKLLSSIPTIKPVLPVRQEVHMLCGRKHLQMGIWASWSVIRHLPDSMLFVHSDGTLAEHDIGTWRRIIPNLHLTTPALRAEIAAAKLRNHPLLREWRDRQIYSAKLLDFHNFGTCDRIISLDSDVLCFASPKELAAGLGSDQPELIWHQDVQSSYAAPIPVLKAALGIDVPERVNTGFLSAKKWSSDDLAFFENSLIKLRKSGVDVFHLWSEQMLYALSIVRHGRGWHLPASYNVSFGRTRNDCVIRHYVGVLRVRPRFYLEGVPRLTQQLGLQT